MPPQLAERRDTRNDLSIAFVPYKAVEKEPCFASPERFFLFFNCPKNQNVRTGGSYLKQLFACKAQSLTPGSKLFVMILSRKDAAIERMRLRCRKKFLRNFPGGFYGEKYISWERDYKWNAHLEWKHTLDKPSFFRLLEAGEYVAIANAAVKIESKTNLLFSFEKMALRDAVRSEEGARRFSEGLYNLVYETSSPRTAFEALADTLAHLPRKQTRVLTWPLQTVFGFIGAPSRHIFLKPRVTQAAAEKYGFPFEYRSRPNWDTYQSLLSFAKQVRYDVEDLKPRDMIDIQSFIWVQGSEEY
jgi:hypothetical protein